MKIWVDDIRTPPDDTWEWYKTSSEVITSFVNWQNNWYTGDIVDVISLDHDLGGEDTTRGIVLWMCQYNWWPVDIRVHSANPVGRDWIEKMVERYKP
jgi:hypothetical protein